MNFLENGVPQRYPNLKIVFCEAGLSWAPFLRMRLDKEYNEQRRAWPHFGDERPSDVIGRMYFATQPVEEPDDRRDLGDLIRIYRGHDTTVFASDWPHHDFDHPRAVFNLPLSPEDKRKVMGENALKRFPSIKVPGTFQARYPAYAIRSAGHDEARSVATTESGPEHQPTRITLDRAVMDGSRASAACGWRSPRSSA
jgi:hypothetical protein